MPWLCVCGRRCPANVTAALSDCTVIVALAAVVWSRSSTLVSRRILPVQRRFLRSPLSEQVLGHSLYVDSPGILQSTVTLH